MSRARALLRPRSLMVAGSALTLLVLGPAGSALADPCPLTDPLCVVDTVEDTVDQTVDTTKDKVDKTVETVQKTVKDLTDPAGEEPGGGGGGGGNDEGDDEVGGGGPGHGPKDQVSVAAPTVGVPSAAAGETVLVTETSLPLVPSEQVTPILARGLPAALREVAVGLALPLLVLLAIVVGFTMIQNRLDRRDPKLALAPLAEDVLRFA
jgi:hypothetical protein